MRRLTTYGLGLALALGALVAAFVMAMRSQFPPVRDAVRRMNRSLVNPRQMETAGKPGAYAAIVKHRGRVSGTVYETPVQALATEDGFVVPLPYGQSADWLRNVMAAGSAVIVHEGYVHEVDHPEIVPSAQADAYVLPQDRRMHRWFGVDQFLRVTRRDAPGMQNHGVDSS